MSQLSLYLLSLSETNLKLYSISQTSKLVTKVITNLDLSEHLYRLLEGVVPVFNNVGERSTAENCHHVSLLFMVSKPVNNRLVDHLYDFQFCFRSP